MRILLNWLPPAYGNIPSAAMSILKAYLNQQKYDVDICYWNLIFKDIIHSFSGVSLEQEVTETAALMPFLAALLKDVNDEEQYNRLSVFYQTKFPQYINIDNNNYYSKTLGRYGNDVKNRFKEVLAHLYSTHDYKLIGVSTKLLQLVPANIFTTISKEISPNTPVVVGGMTSKEEAIATVSNFSIYDYAIWGEGENSLHQLCRYIEGEIPIEEVPNLVYRSGNEIHCGKSNKYFTNLSEVHPDFSDYFSYLKENSINDFKPIIPIEGSRGCHWNQCKFCFLTEGYKNRSKSNDAIIKEIIQTIEDYNIYTFTFLDNDIIFNDFEKFDDLLDKLRVIKDKYEPFGIYNGEVVTKGLSASIIKKMTLGGFISIQIGYEATSDSILRKISKKNTFSSNLMFVKWACQYNLRLQRLIVITGLLGESDEDIFESIKNMHYLRFFLEKGITRQYLSPLNVMKTSKYFKQIIANNELDEYNVNLIHSFLPKQYIDDSQRFDMMSFGKSERNSLWDYFGIIDEYYSAYDFSYKLYQIDNHTIQYVENIESKQVNKLEFDTEQTYHWKILQYCNEEVRSFDNLSKYFNIESNNKEQERLKSALQDLNDEKLLYSNPEYSENISVINTEFVH